MNTAPLQNSAGLLQNALPAARQGGANPAPTPFNQVLSNEVAQRRDAGNVDGPTASAKPADANQAPATTEQANGVRSGTETGQANEKASNDDSAPVVTASAELLALVAGLQRADSGASTAVAADAQEGEAEGKAGTRNPAVALDADLARGTAASKADTSLAPDDGKVELAANGKVADTSRDAALKPDPGFAAAIRQASEAKAAPDPNLLKNPEAAATPTVAQLAPGVVQANQDLAVAAANKLTPPVGTPAWDAALGQKIVWLAAGGQQSASLTLNPPDLGPLQVVLHVTNSHADATFISAHLDVRQALEAAMPRLREMMNDAGIQLDQANVSTGTPDQQQAHGGPTPRRAAPGIEAAGGHADTPVQSGHAHVTSGGRGLVDTFA